MVTWDTAFHAEPANTDDIADGAKTIRETRIGVEERADEEHNWGPGAGENDGRHLQGSATAFTTEGTTTGPTKISVPATAMPVVADGAGRALDAKDQGRLWVNEGGQISSWSGSAWVLNNNIDPALMADSDSITATHSLPNGGWTVIRKDGTPTDLECNVTIPAQGLWRIQVNYCIAIKFEGPAGADPNCILRLRLEDSAALVTNIGLGFMETVQGSTQNVRITGVISGSRSFLAALVTEVYSIKIEAFTARNGATGVGANGRKNSTDISWIETFVLPFGA